MDDLIKLDDLLREFWEGVFEDFWPNLTIFGAFTLVIAGILAVLLLIV